MNEMKKVSIKDKLKRGYQAIENKIIPIAASGMLAIAGTMVSASAESAAGIALATINKDDVINAMSPFVNAGIPLLAVVGGLKLGKSFLKSCMH